MKDFSDRYEAVISRKSPVVARSFVKDMTAFFAEDDGHMCDAIAVRQLRALREQQGPREKALRLSDVKELFAQIKNHTTFSRQPPVDKNQ